MSGRSGGDCYRNSPAAPGARGRTETQQTALAERTAFGIVVGAGSFLETGSLLSPGVWRRSRARAAAIVRSLAADVIGGTRAIGRIDHD